MQMAADLKGPLVWASNGEKIRGKQCSEDRGRGWGPGESSKKYPFCH